MGASGGLSMPEVTTICRRAWACANLSAIEPDSPSPRSIWLSFSFGQRKGSRAPYALMAKSRSPAAVACRPNLAGASRPGRSPSRRADRRARRCACPPSLSAAQHLPAARHDPSCRHAADWPATRARTAHWFRYRSCWLLTRTTRFIRGSARWGLTPARVSAAQMASETVAWVENGLVRDPSCSAARRSVSCRSTSWRTRSPSLSTVLTISSATVARPV